MSPREFHVPVPGGELSGHDYAGEGPDVVLVPSVGYNEDVWRQTAILLSRHARVVTFDLRGHGQSTCEVEDDRVRFLQDLTDLADALELEAPVLVGHQFGGGVASLAVALHPERFGALCLVDSPMTAPRQSYLDLLDLFTTQPVMDLLVERFGLGVSGRGQATLDVFVEEQSKKMAQDWISLAVGREGARQTVLRGTLVQPTGEWTRRPTPETCCTLVTLPDDFFALPGRELLEEFTLPVWALQPLDGDYGEGFAEFAELAAARPGWVARELPGAVDAVQSHHGAVVEQLRGLLRGLTVRRPPEGQGDAEAS